MCGQSSGGCCPLGVSPQRRVIDVSLAGHQFPPSLAVAGPSLKFDCKVPASRGRSGVRSEGRDMLSALGLRPGCCQVTRLESKRCLNLPPLDPPLCARSRCPSLSETRLVCRRQMCEGKSMVAGQWCRAPSPRQVRREMWPASPERSLMGGGGEAGGRSVFQCSCQTGTAVSKHATSRVQCKVSRSLLAAARWHELLLGAWGNTPVCPKRRKIKAQSESGKFPLCL